MNNSPLNVKEPVHLSLNKINSDLVPEPLPKFGGSVGGDGRNSPDSPSFNLGGFNFNVEAQE
jgi:hypothetical protein|tara:strand:+ start:2063 stop:2248 length:186 start_codon:yes stop_codon:yes gene_type:complete